MKNFSLKFLGIMVGIVLGLGFQWWPNLTESWQYIAFIFVYVDIVDYWMDYGPSLKKFPPKREIDVMLDVAIMFSLFLYIYSTQSSFVYFLGAFILTRVLDYFWLLSSKYEFRPTGTDELYINSWLDFNLIEGFVALVLVLANLFLGISVLPVLLIFIGLRIVIQILASWRYKKVHFI